MSTLIQGLKALMWKLHGVDGDKSGQEKKGIL